MNDPPPPSARPSARLILGFAFVCVLLIVFLLMLCDKRRKSQPLDQFAQDVVKAVDANNASFLLSVMMPHEKTGLQMNKEKLSALLDWYHKMTANAETNPSLALEFGQDGDMLTAARAVSTDVGRFDLVFIIYRTDDGPRAFITDALVMSGLRAKYSRKEDKGSIAYRNWAAVGRGVKAERQFFDSIKLIGTVDSTPKLKIITWKDLEDFVDRLGLAQ